MAKWRRIPFYDVIGKPEAIRTTARKGCFKEDDKWQCVVGIDIIIFSECVRKVYQNLRLHLPLVLRLQKVQER